MFDWLPINRLAEARVARCEVGNRCNGKLICYRDCLISLSLSLPAFTLVPLYPLGTVLSVYLSCFLPVNCTEAVFERLNLPQNKSPPVRRPGESWLESARDSGSCPSRVYFFFFFFLIFQLSVSWSSSPLFRNAVPPTPPYICVCQCGSWSGILNAVYSCCGWVAKARYGRQLVIRLIMLPFFFLWSRP